MDQDAVLLRSHQRQDRGRDVEGARQVAVDDGVDARRVKLRPAALADVDAGVVDEDVEAPEALPDRGDDAVDLRRVGHVAGLDVGAPARGLDRGGDAPQRLLAAPGENDRGAGPRERERAGLADPRAGAGHPGRLSLKLRHRSPSAFSSGSAT